MFFYPKMELTRVNLKSVASASDLKHISAASVLRGLQQSLLKRIRTKIMQGAFSERARKALYNGVAVRVGPSSVTIVATHPAFKPLVEGRRPRQMTWLTKATRPIPIVLDSGEVIFRNATPRSMENGSWYHPGRKPTDIVDVVRTEAKEAIKKRVAADLKKQLRQALSAKKK